MKKLLRSNSKMFITICILSSFVIGLSYAAFKVNSTSYKATNMMVSKLMYGISISEINKSTSTINGNVVTIPANTKSYFYVTISSINKIDSKYSLAYKSSNSVVVKYSDKSEYTPTEEIEGFTTTNTYSKVVKISIDNTSNDISTEVTINAFGGYTHNDYTSIILDSGYLSISNTYEEGQDINLISYTLNGSVTDKSYDTLVSDYVVNSITCENGTVGAWDDTNKSIKFSNIQVPDYCTIDFTLPPTLANVMLRDNPTISERTDFSVTNVANTTGTIYKTNKTEDGNYVYYYSGNTINNWVKFDKENKSCTYNGIEVEHYENGSVETEEECLSSNVCDVGSQSVVFSLDTRDIDTTEYVIYYIVGITASECYHLQGKYLSEKAEWKDVFNDIYWRIIRTNEDGSVRLLYAGTSHDTTEGYIGTSAFNSTNNESRYAGYMYGGNTSLADNRTNTTNSTIKTYIDNWYKNNLLTNYDKYISKTAIYCNDRSVGSGTWSNNSSSTFYYGASTRLNDNNTPTYKCGGDGSGELFESTQAVEDKFSASTIGGGNGQLKYPIALMTADEFVFAGGKFGNELSSPYVYYYTNSAGNSIIESQWWWLLSPFGFGGRSFMFSVVGSDGTGGVGISVVDSDDPVRPVVSLSSCAKVTGTGTPEDPYIIDEANSTC